MRRSEVCSCRREELTGKFHPVGIGKVCVSQECGLRTIMIIFENEGMWGWKNKVLEMSRETKEIVEESHGLATFGTGMTAKKRF